MDLGEGAFGFAVRDKSNNDNSMLLIFENLDEIFVSFDELKKQFKGDKK
jgi:hypothetical protein